MTLPRGRPRSSTKALEPRSTLTSTAPGGSAAAPIIVDDVEDLLAAASEERDNVWLWRRGGGRWDFLAPLTPLELRELGIRVTVQQRYGGGQFKARLRERGGKWGVSREFSIEGEPKTPPRDDTPATGAIASSSSSSSPDWVRSIVLPIATTLGTALAAALAKKMFETPAIDPLLAKLLDRMGRGEGVNPLELQRLLLEAETRGENRGRELGELTAAVDAPRGGGESSGVAGAINQAVPVIHRMLDMATTNRRARRGGAVAHAPALPASTPSDTTTSSSSGAAVPDIVPSWLRPFIGYKWLLLNVADRGKNAGQYADMIMDQIEDDEQLLTAVVEANAAGRLFTDLVAAIPEITGKPERERFAGELVTAIQDSLKELTIEDAPATATDAAPPATEAANA